MFQTHAGSHATGLRFSDKARLSATGEYVRGTQRHFSCTVRVPPVVCFLHWKVRGDTSFEVRHPGFRTRQAGIIHEILIGFCMFLQCLEGFVYASSIVGCMRSEFLDEKGLKNFFSSPEACFSCRTDKNDLWFIQQHEWVIGYENFWIMLKFDLECCFHWFTLGIYALYNAEFFLILAICSGSLLRRNSICQTSHV